MRVLSIFFLLALLTIGTMGYSQNRVTTGSGFGKTIKASNNYVTKEMQVENFTELSLTGACKVIYKQQAGEPTMEIYTSDNLFDLLDMYVKDQTLCIGIKKNVRVSYKILEIRLSSETLNSIALTGSGEINLSNGLNTDNLNITVTGSGDFEGSNITCNDLTTYVNGSGEIEINSIDCSNLKATVSGSGVMTLNGVVTKGKTIASVTGSGDIFLSGSTDEAEYSISGSGDMDTTEYSAKQVTAKVSGSGNIKCYASDYLKVRTTGSGTVKYKGDPKLDFTKKGLYKLE